MIQYIELNRDMQATPAAADMTARLKAAGADVIDLGQGSEKRAPRGELGRLLSDTRTPDPEYQSEILGPVATREAGAGFLQRFLGIPAEADTVFAGEQLGRTMQYMAWFTAAQPHQGKGYLPVTENSSLSWSFINAQAKNVGLSVVHYDVTSPDVAAAVRETGDAIPEGQQAAIYVNSIHNATGRLYTADENKAIGAYADEKNDRITDDRKVHMLHDNPYFASLPRNTTGGAYLNSGYEDVLNLDSKTPWIHAVSFSKAFASAHHGLAIVAADRQTAKRLATNFSMSGLTTGYSTELMSNLTIALSPQMDGEVLAHLDSLRENYEANRKHLVERFGNRVLEGRPSVPALVRFKPEELLDRHVKCRDGRMRVLHDLTAVVEWLGNEHGVTVVDNGNDKDGNLLIRFAQAQPHEIFAEGISRAERGLNQLLTMTPGPQPTRFTVPESRVA